MNLYLKGTKVRKSLHGDVEIIPHGTASAQGE
jgi:hypothetical protein